MLLPPTSFFDHTIYPFAKKSYPAAILVKHHMWFFSNADLFISLDGVLYGVHQFYFDQSPLSQEIIYYGEANKIGVIPLHPISFNTLKKRILDNFLHILYFGIEQLEHLKREDWVNVKCLSMVLQFLLYFTLFNFVNIYLT
jgi:hypothetical protein